MTDQSANPDMLPDALRVSLHDAQRQVNALVLGKEQAVRFAFTALLLHFLQFLTQSLDVLKKLAEFAGVAFAALALTHLALQAFFQVFIHSHAIFGKLLGYGRGGSVDVRLKL